ncbi:hypothetical protein HOD75_02350 [archaeon]|jgi:hypothetical protein|nr:hypothetical protein [archaeon]MBT4241719.1 hypothetical protein [archaeon]MBT4418267.1 hypothetical protein [archaeon]
MVDPIFVSPLFMNFILPFVLIFTLIFAILQKTQLLGENKQQIDAMIGAVVGIILIATPYARDIVVLLMPFLAVVASILLVFMLLYGFMMGKTNGDVLDQGWKYAFGAILAVALGTFLLMITGYWDLVYNYLFSREGSPNLWINVLLIAIAVGAVVAVIKGGAGNSE